jgi:hypothetical protein
MRKHGRPLGRYIGREGLKHHTVSHLAADPSQLTRSWRNANANKTERL